MSQAPPTPAVLHGISLLGAQDLHLFNEGTHRSLGERLGAHVLIHDGVAGTVFAVWAPSARSVSVIGEFNHWQPAGYELAPRGSSGIWEGFLPGVGHGALYKYSIELGDGGRLQKADPYAAYAELPPRTASRVWDLEHEWSDGAWMAGRAERNGLESPISIYELHLGSWRRNTAENRPLTYVELAEQLPRYAVDNGFTHVELLPVMEHPFTGSWGYQTTGYFAPTSRFGTPQDFMGLIDALHNAGVGVVLDWVPSHFPTDPHGLSLFDGTHLYEHADPRQGFHPDWGSYIFNYGRHEVRSFLHLERDALARRATTPTGCGSTPSPRCSTSTTPARRASGSPTSTAAARTSGRSSSCARSTRPSTASIPTCRPTPRSRRRGRWCRGRPTSAGSASA